MKLEVLQENLNHGLSIVSRCLVNKPQIPILTNLLFNASAGSLEITASNLETTITTIVGAKVDVEGKFTLPGKTVCEVVVGMASEKIEMKLNDGVFSFSAGKFKAKINGTPADEFPLVPNLSDSISLTLDSKTFLAALNKTLFSTALDESRAVLTGILFKTTNEGLTLASTDGFRLSVAKIAVDVSQQEFKFIVPAKALVEVSRILTEKTFVLNYSPSTNQIMFDLGDTKIFSRLVSGNFPDFDKIIPTNTLIKVVIPSDEFLKTIKLAAVFARDSANIVKLKIQNSKIKISANAAQVGENESEIDVVSEKGETEELVIAFNYKYLLDLLNNVGATEIVAEFNGPLASGLFKTSTDANYLHIIMPVRVQN